MKTIDIQTLERRLGSEERPMVLDVRSPSEFATGHIPGAVNVPLDEVESRVDDIPEGASVVTLCESGKRATEAAERLAAKGIEATVFKGSTSAWREAGKPLVASTPTGWSMERQVRLGAGAMVVTGAVLGLFVDRRWLALAGLVGAGLTYSGVSNSCGMAKALQKMPWNKPAGSGAAGKPAEAK